MEYKTTPHLSEWLSLKSINNKCWQACGGKETLVHTVGGNVNQHSHYGGPHEGSSKTKDRTTVWSNNCTPGYIHIYEENKNTNSKRYMYSNVHSIIIYKSQYMEATQVPLNG